ncbi:hypothetical protein ACIO93_34920 [Streptomyces sp. NPDC087903]|uniref:hypothetical protein n=1 Tax=Streptomyces sp. NPDC087903 TaxID=3365819 RepID=UPI0037F708CE
MGALCGARRGGRAVDAQCAALAFPLFRRSRVFEVRADFERAMPHSEPDTRGLHLGCGAALLNLRTAVAHDGRHPEVTLLPDVTDRALLARVRLSNRASDESGLGTLYRNGRICAGRCATR